MAWTVPDALPPVGEKATAPGICLLIMLVGLSGTLGCLFLFSTESGKDFWLSVRALKIYGGGYLVTLLLLTAWLLPTEWNNAFYHYWMGWRGEAMANWLHQRRECACLVQSVVLAPDAQLTEKIAGIVLPVYDEKPPHLLFSERDIAPGRERFIAIFQALAEELRDALSTVCQPFTLYIQTGSSAVPIADFELGEIWQQMALPAYAALKMEPDIAYTALLAEIRQASSASVVFAVAFDDARQAESMTELGCALLFLPNPPKYPRAARFFTAMPCHQSELRSDFRQQAWLQQQPADSIKMLLTNGTDKRASALLTGQLAEAGISLRREAKNSAIADLAFYAADYQALAPWFMLAISRQLIALDYGNLWLLFSLRGELHLQAVGKDAPQDRSAEFAPAASHFPCGSLCLALLLTAILFLTINSLLAFSVAPMIALPLLAMGSAVMFLLLVIIQGIVLRNTGLPRFLRQTQSGGVS